MKRLFISTVILACALFSASAQKVTIKADVKGANIADLALVVKPMNIDGTGETVKPTVTESAFEAEVDASAEGFYSLYGKRNGGQLVVPFYLSKNTGVQKLKIEFKDNEILIDKDANNRALSAFNNIYYNRMREYFTNERNMSDEQKTAFVKAYINAGDSIAKRYKCDEKVSEYLKVWAFVTSVTMRNLDVAPQTLLDTPVALYFPSLAPHMIATSLPKGTMSSQLESLNATYKCEPLKKRVAGILLDGYITKFVSTPTTYAQGLDEVTSVVNAYNLSNKYIETFKTRKAPAKGKAFPALAKIVDASGKAVDFSQFHGSYVYIDLWASWCVPCVKEIPYLQELEKALEDHPVHFVSISLDRDEAAWKKKMQDLNVHGNQFISKDEVLAETFDVRGIPRFLLFDKEGNVIDSNATRPSDPQTLETLKALK